MDSKKSKHNCWSLFCDLSQIIIKLFARSIKKLLMKPRNYHVHNIYSNYRTFYKIFFKLKIQKKEFYIYPHFGLIWLWAFTTTDIYHLVCYVVQLICELRIRPKFNSLYWEKYLLHLSYKVFNSIDIRIRPKTTITTLMKNMGSLSKSSLWLVLSISSFNKNEIKLLYYISYRDFLYKLVKTQNTANNYLK